MKYLLSKILDLVGKILALVLLVLLLLEGIHNNFDYCLPEKLMTIIVFVRTYGLIIFCGIVLTEGFIKHSIILAIIGGVLIAAVLILHCCPGATDAMRNMFG